MPVILHRAAPGAEVYRPFRATSILIIYARLHPELNIHRPCRLYQIKKVKEALKGRKMLAKGVALREK
jgi:hypothetical protein